MKGKNIVMGKITLGDAEHDISLTFDCIYKEWIQRLLSFIQRIGAEQSRYTLCMFQFKYDFLNQPEYSFLGTSCAAISQFLYMLIKDELSEATANFALPYLCENLATGKYRIDYDDSIKFITRLLKDDFNSILAPSFLDTYVSVWSCFESAIISITAKYEDSMLDEISESNFKKYKKLTEKVLSGILSPDKIAPVLKEKKAEIIKQTPIYISFPDRINYLFKQMKDEYKRDVNQDKNTLLFLGALRNTVHNNARHIKNDMEISVRGKSFCLKKGEVVYFESYIDVVVLFEELFDIYCEILRYVTQQKITELSD